MEQDFSIPLALVFLYFYSFAILLSGKIFGESVFNLLANASGILFSAYSIDIFNSV